MIFLDKLLHHFTILTFHNFYYLLQFINFHPKQILKRILQMSLTIYKKYIKKFQPELICLQTVKMVSSI